MKRIKQNSLKLCVIYIDTSYFRQFLLLLLLLNSLLCTFTVGLVWIDFSNPYPREFFWHFTLTFWHCNTFSHEDDELLCDFHIPLKVSAKLLKKNIPRFPSVFYLLSVSSKSCHKPDLVFSVPSSCNLTPTGITSIKSENCVIFERMKQSCAKHFSYDHFIQITFESCRKLEVHNLSFNSDRNMATKSNYIWKVIGVWD